MATRKQISYGSQGSDVKELQSALNSKGYSLDVDGVFGSKTRAAVRDYQSKNKLQVDGIVGTNTWGSLFPTTTASAATTTKPAATTTKPAATTTKNTATTSGATSGKTTTSTPTTTSGTKAAATKVSTVKPTSGTPATVTPSKTSAKDALANVPEFSYAEYAESPTVTAAKQALQAQLANKPGEYKSTYQQQINDTLNKILNREEFSYDLNGDALYQQYKDQYATQGKQAMMDTMGQAAALTGGYGNSYAQSVGQQTYQGYLQQLNDKVPELYQLALDKYNAESDALLNQYNLYSDRESADYNRYRDTVSDYYANLDRLNSQYLDERNFDYGQYSDARNHAYQTNRDKISDAMWAAEFGYGQERDAIADSQWAQNFNENLRQYNQNFAYGMQRDDISDQQWQRQYEDSLRQYAEQFAYQQSRDQAADSQWQSEFDEAMRRWNLANGLNADGTPIATGKSGGGGGSSGSSKNSSSSTTKLTTPKANKNATDATAKTGGLASFDPIKAKSFTNNDDLLDYLNNCLDRGVITEKQFNEYYSKYAITKNLNTSGSKYAYGTGATGGWNYKTASDYYWK